MKFHEISRAEISEADFNPAIAGLEKAILAEVLVTKHVYLVYTKCNNRWARTEVCMYV